jgi:regulator of sirC expression with transglutaminase-like and TPR domain
MQARERFAELIERPDEEIPLAEAALWIAAEANPAVDVAARLAEIDSLAERVRNHVGPGGNVADRVDRLNDGLFVHEGFAGNVEQYSDPRNSFLDAVLERRTGIPITLAVVYIEVGRRLGLDVSGVGFPGHFLAKVKTTTGEIVIDPFFGRILSPEHCAERLRRIGASPEQFDRAILASVTHRAILRRLLVNLKHGYVGQRDWERALGCCDRILMLVPDEPVELRDRGLIYRELECFGAALEDIDRFYRQAPEDPERVAMRPVLEGLRARSLQVH